jgi:hypothetical protein
MEGWRVRKDGSGFLANVLITAIRDGSGALRGFAKLTHDITESNEAEKALARETEGRQRGANLEPSSENGRAWSAYRRHCP